ncbi:MAG: 6-phosphogluconolactonase [Spirochaetota bacterium]
MKIVVADQHTILRRIGKLLEKELSPVLARRGSGALGLPGGTSVVPLLEALPAVPLPWDRVGIFLVDERFVPKDHPDSNYGLIAGSIERAFAGAPAKPEILPLPGSEPGPAAAAAAYGEILKERTEGTGVFDLAVLGVGEDGHIASIFPERPLDLATPPGFSVIGDSPKPPPVRVTANASLLTSTPCLIGLLFGVAKAEAYRRLTGGASAATFPAALIREAPRGYLFADYSAAGGVSEATSGE